MLNNNSQGFTIFLGVFVLSDIKINASSPGGKAKLFFLKE